MSDDADSLSIPVLLPTSPNSGMYASMVVGPAQMHGSTIRTAQAQFDQFSSQWVVSYSSFVSSSGSCPTSQSTCTESDSWPYMIKSSARTLCRPRHSRSDRGQQVVVLASSQAEVRALPVRLNLKTDNIAVAQRDAAPLKRHSAGMSKSGDETWRCTQVDLRCDPGRRDHRRRGSCCEWGLCRCHGLRWQEGGDLSNGVADDLVSRRRRWPRSHRRTRASGGDATGEQPDARSPSHSGHPQRL